MQIKKIKFSSIAKIKLKIEFKGFNYKIKPYKMILKKFTIDFKKVYNIFLKETYRIIFAPQGTIYILAETGIGIRIGIFDFTDTCLFVI